MSMILVTISKKKMQQLKKELKKKERELLPVKMLPRLISRGALKLSIGLYRFYWKGRK